MSDGIEQENNMEYLEKITRLGISIRWDEGILHSRVDNQQGTQDWHIETHTGTHQSKIKALVDSIEFWEWSLSE